MEDIQAEKAGGTGATPPETDWDRRGYIACIRKTINGVRCLVVLKGFTLFSQPHDFSRWRIGGGGKRTLVARIVFYQLNGKLNRDVLWGLGSERRADWILVDRNLRFGLSRLWMVIGDMYMSC